MNEKSKLYQALLKSQTEIENAHKDAKNPYFNSTYSTLNSVLDACKAILNKNGILIAQKCEGLKLTTTLIHSESGEEISSTLDLISIPDMQKLGSAITYARRYTLQALIAIGAEDDDANSVSIEPNKRDPSKNYTPFHEPSTSTRYPTYGFCSQCFAPMYLSKKGTSIYCSNYRDKTIEHDSNQYTGQPQLPDDIDTYDKWIKYKSQPIKKTQTDIMF